MVFSKTTGVDVPRLEVNGVVRNGVLITGKTASLHKNGKFISRVSVMFPDGQTWHIVKPFVGVESFGICLLQNARWEITGKTASVCRKMQGGSSRSDNC